MRELRYIINWILWTSLHKLMRRRALFDFGKYLHQGHFKCRNHILHLRSLNPFTRLDLFSSSSCVLRSNMRFHIQIPWLQIVTQRKLVFVACLLNGENVQGWYSKVLVYLVGEYQSRIRKVRSMEIKI